MKKNIAVLISGSGSDMQSVIDACESGKINGQIVCVVANKDNIFGLERAEKHGIPHQVFKAIDYEGDMDLRDEAIAEYIASFNTELIILAGYLSILTPQFIASYRGRIINIHPSLIPKYCGTGMYGIRVHEAVVAAKEKFSGATVHYVDENADTGAIIAQEQVEVLENDTADTLQKRVLELEHDLLPRVVAKLCK